MPLSTDTYAEIDVCSKIIFPFALSASSTGASLRDPCNLNSVARERAISTILLVYFWVGIFFLQEIYTERRAGCRCEGKRARNSIGHGDTIRYDRLPKLWRSGYNIAKTRETRRYRRPFWRIPVLNFTATWRLRFFFFFFLFGVNPVYKYLRKTRGNCLIS